MQIVRLLVSNFRSFDHFDVFLDGKSVVLIGENGSGKSSLLTAVARALGRDTHFTKADFRDPTQPISITATLGDLSPSQRGTFGNYVEFGRDGPTLQVECRATWDDHSEDVEVEHRYPKTASRSKREERDAIPLHWLGASRDPGRVLALGAAANMMSKLLDTSGIGTALQSAVDDVEQAALRLANDPTLAALLSDARDDLASLIPEVKPDPFSLGTTALSPRDFLRQFELMLDHGSVSLAIRHQSSGLAQLVVFVVALHLMREDSDSILLVDEPEMSLHPQSQRALVGALRAANSQMLIATHSAHLLDRADPRNVIRLGLTPGGVVMSSPSTISDEDAARLSRLTNTETAEAFFARSVILVEGRSDKAALETLADRQGRNLDGEGVAVVAVGGSKGFKPHLQLYGVSGFGLRVAGMCDEAEEPDMAAGLEAAGYGTGVATAERERLGFYVCRTDLEEELVRALGERAVSSVIESRGDEGRFRVFSAQPAFASMPLLDRQRAFVARRKVEYAVDLVDALDLGSVPPPLARVLSHV